MISIWDIEELVKAKEKLKNILKDRHVDVSDDDNLNILIDKTAIIGDDNLNKLLENRIEYFKNDKITSIKSYCFSNLTNLKSIDILNVNEIKDYAFSGASALKKFVTYNIGMYSGNCTFRGCSSLEKVIMPFFKTYSPLILTFYECSKLKLVDVNRFGTMGDSCFNNCLSLRAIIIRNELISPLPNKNNLNGTPLMANTGGYVYVPEILVDNYKVANNWKLIANRILPLEGTIYEDPYWSKKEAFYAIIDGVEVELPKDTTVELYKNTFQVQNLYSDGIELSNDQVIYNLTNTTITTKEI